MRGGKDLLASERGMWCVALALIACAFVVFEYITGAEWVSFMIWMTGTLVFAKTASGIASRTNQTAPVGVTP